MGSISTHYEITRSAQEQMKHYLPHEDYFFLEFGNYLTDVSQFRDPTAHFGAKPTLLRRARQLRLEHTGLALASGILTPDAVDLGLVEAITRYANALLGTPENRIGILADYFEQMILGITLHAATAQQADINEVERIYIERFTQYYPHEHLDFPPLNDYRHLGFHPLFRPSGTNLIGYLEEFIQYISEQLSIIEHRWKLALPNTTSGDSRRHDILASLGHVLHAIEDYYFHSNFAEIWWLEYRKRRSTDPGPMGNHPSAQWCEWFEENAYLNRPLSERPLQYKRKFFRRLRFPYHTHGPGGGVPSRTHSTDGSQFIYTGGFAQNDVFHTIYDALKGIESRFNETYELPNGQDINIQPPWENSGLVMLENIFSERNRRRMMEDEDYLDSVITAHKSQLTENVYQTRISARTGPAANQIPPRAANAFLRAYDMDKEFAERYSFSPGIGGFLLTIISLTQQEAEASQAIIESYNSPPVVCQESTDNRASSEQIGTHSLMAKDSPLKIPFRKEALALASAASASIAGILAAEIADTRTINHRIWWDTVVRHYLRFPRLSRNSWESQIAVAARLNADIDPRVLRDRPEINRLLATDSRIRNRLRDRTRSRLERRYTDLERAAHRRWRSAIAEPMPMRTS